MSPYELRTQGPWFFKLFYSDLVHQGYALASSYCQLQDTLKYENRSNVNIQTDQNEIRALSFTFHPLKDAESGNDKEQSKIGTKRK